MNETRDMTERELIGWLGGCSGDGDIERSIRHLQDHVFTEPVMYLSQIKRLAFRTGVSSMSLLCCLRVMAREGLLTFDGEVIRKQGA
jgi:hypothetical protein